MVCLFLLTLCGCREGERLPGSTGQPYEVLLEGDTDSVVTRMLTTDVPGLPQPEPFCRLLQVKRNKVKGSYLLLRTRISVRIDPQCKGYSVKKQNDVNARPQLVIQLEARSAEELRRHLDGGKLRQLVDSFELQHLAIAMKSNPRRQKEVAEQFGLQIKIPEAMDAAKKGKDFLWLSNNASTGMQNLLFLQTGDDSQETVNRLLEKCITGETDSMYMQLTTQDGPDRGLWEMKGDIMGGPYVKRTFTTARGQQTVVIGFVYAPETKKRNFIKQLEAVLTTASRRPTPTK